MDGIQTPLVPGTPTFQALELPLLFHPQNQQEGTTKPNKTEQEQEIKNKISELNKQNSCNSPYFSPPFGTDTHRAQSIA